ncbi:two-pore potassium channel 3-like [Olea europaea subsp. europaea]|uniref:Two-pore potassium channel 3-like n=1 Tax=Olea europaea subsp. europaea TaxID=158383 RepID=A0A8S0TPR1_OLEEU|nr:two-pore potassium channel 3-like [Olea europaea subsp. europaea]
MWVVKDVGNLMTAALITVHENTSLEDAVRSYIVDAERMRIQMRVAFALGVVVLWFRFVVAVMQFVVMSNLVVSFYLSVMLFTSVGYGDRAFASLPGRIFTSIWLLK